MTHQRRQDILPVCFDIHDPKEYFSDNKACCSKWLVHGINNETASEAGEYFAKCQEALATVDIPIALEIGVLDVDGQQNLSAQGYARLFVAAASGDSSKASDLFDSLSAKTKLHRSMISSVEELILEYSGH
jgi:hypothetical protein